MITIGKVAALAHVSTDALRYYQQEGLIHPSAISESGYRLYGDDAAPRVRYIKQAQACSFTLAEIGELLRLRENGNACCNEVRRVAIEKKLQLEAKIKAMTSMSKALDIMITDCDNDDLPIGACPILVALEQAKSGGKT